MSTLSRSIARDDAPRKSSGAVRYLADLPIEGTLHAALLLSSRPHARLVAVELPALPCGYTRVDFRDVPGRNAVAMINESWPLFPAERVCHTGQPILLVTGPDRAVLADLVDGARVEYEDLEPMIGIDGADTFVDYHLRGAPGPRAARDAAKEADDAGPPRAQAISLTETFETGLQEHVYLEPQAMAAWVENGRIVVCGSMQCPYYVKHAVEVILGLGPDRVQVVQSTTGGAFGGKEEYPSFLAGLVAVAAWKTGTPVRLVLDRSVDMRMSTKRHPSRITLASRLGSGGGAGSGARLLDSSIDVRTDGGAFEGLSAVVLQRAMFAASGVYRIPEVLVRGRAHRTNVVPSGAFRGFGSPQAFFAIEMHMSHLARLVGEDPADFKRRHLLRQGDLTVTGGRLRDRVLVEEMLDDVLDRSDYRKKRGRNERGKGVGLSIFSHGCGFTGSGERDIIKARVRLRLLPDETVEILCSNVEMGQGAETTLRKIVAATLEIDFARVAFAAADTDRVPDSGPTVASRTVMVVGGLLERAALRLKGATGTDARGGPIEVEEVYRQPPGIEWDQETFTGDAYAAFSWGVNVVEIEVDLLTFEIRPVSVWAAYDVGVPVDERIVTGQVHGGIVQGLGYATCEVLETRDGALRQATMTDYTIPGPLDVPPIDVRFFENPYQGGPFGAKGAGEIPFTGAAPAVADAVECALGVTIDRIPITPEYLEGACG